MYLLCISSKKIVATIKVPTLVYWILVFWTVNRSILKGGERWVKKSYYPQDEGSTFLHNTGNSLLGHAVSQRRWPQPNLLVLPPQKTTLNATFYKVPLPHNICDRPLIDPTSKNMLHRRVHIADSRKFSCKEGIIRWYRIVESKHNY